MMLITENDCHGFKIIMKWQNNQVSGRYSKEYMVEESQESIITLVAAEWAFAGVV